MEHQQIRTLFGQHLAQLVARPGDLPVTPRPYQVETLDSTARWLLNPDGTRRGYVVHATGLGKTVIFASMVAAASGMRSLVVVPTKLLLAQTARVISKFTGGVLGHLSSLAHIHDETGETIAIRGLDHSPIVLTTDASFNKLAAAIKRDFDPHIIIRDECHWGYIDSALAAMNEFPEAVIIAFSATPDFLTNAARDGYTPVTLENGQVLYGPRDRFAETHFGTCLDRRTIRWGIESGWLCPLAWGRIEFDVPLKEVRVVETPDGADYDQSELQKLMGKHWPVMCETVRRLYQNHEYELADRQAYAVCPSVEAAQELAEAVNSLGIPAACVTGTTPDTERDILLQAYQENEIRFLTSVMVLREGWDAPNAEVCMMLRPTKSRVLYEQAMGRVLRPRVDGENKVALVLDAHFQSQTFYPLSAPELYAKPGDEIRIGDFLIGGGGGGVRGGESDSPYLPKDAQPRLVVVERYGTEDGIVHHANANGEISVQGLLYLNRPATAKRLSLKCSSGIEKRLASSSIRKVWGRGYGGQKLLFFCWEDVASQNADLLGPVQRCTTGFLVDEAGKRWENIPFYCRSRDLKESPVRTWVAKHQPLFQQARIANGRRDRFYSVEALDPIYQELQERRGLLQASIHGEADADGERWMTETPMLHLLEVSGDAWKRRREGVKSRPGLDWGGHPTTLYCLSEAKSAVSDLRQHERVDKDGTLKVNGEIHGSIGTLHKILRKKAGPHSTLNRRTVEARLKEARAPSIKANNLSGAETDLYSLSLAEAVCKDLLEQEHRADEQGFFSADNLRWGLAIAYATIYQTTETTIRKRAQKGSVKTRTGLNRIGHVKTFYEESGMSAAMSSPLKRGGGR